MRYCANGQVWVDEAQACVPMDSGVFGSVPIKSGGNNSTNPWWSGNNINDYASAVAAIWSAVSGKPNTVIYQQPPVNNTPPQDNSWIGWVVGVLGAIIILFMLFYFLGRRKK